MKQARKWIFSVLFVIMALALVFAFAACGGSKDDVPSGDIPSEDEPQAGQTYGYGEQGTYYMDTSDGEYLLVMSSGVIVVSVGGDIGDMGTYTCDGSGAMTITFGGDTQTASYKDGAVTVNVQGTNYTFLLRTEYEVKFVSDTGVTSVAVVNGRAAERPADPVKDGYAFLGWYEDSAYTVKYDFTTGVTQDTTLYARFEKYSESGEFEITFMDGNTVMGTGSTIGGKVLEFPEEGSWWVSDTENGDKLTYRYTDEVLDQSTTLFLNNSYAIGVSVTESGVHVENVMGNMTIAIVSPDGTGVTATFASSNYSYDFSSLSGGEYEITVTYGTTSETAYYTNKALARASVFTVADSRVLMWNEIVGAAYYTVSISCGSTSHTHEDIYVGTNRYYDFSDCDMPKDGIVFSVTAYADGYVSSTGTYTYFKGLDRVAVSVSGDVLTWTDVSGAMGYEIYIDGEYIGMTSMTSYSLKAYAPGTYRLSVKPVTQGYYSEETEYSYSKTSVAAPGITSVEDGVISWNDVDGASYYAVMIDGAVVASSVSATSFDVSDQNLDLALSVHTVSVRAIPGSGSQYTASEYSDPMSFTKDYMGSALTYSDGVITWQYSLDAVCYIVTVNNEDETLVYGQNSAKITLTKSGDNEIAVKYVDADGNYSSVAQISVYAYAIIFDARGGTVYDENGNETDVMYVAQGDTVYLPVPEAEYSNFGGWYTLPDLTYDENSLTYGGEGVLFVDGTIFGQNGSLVLYAAWTNIPVSVTFETGGMGSLTDEDGKVVTGMQVALGSSSYTFPVPESEDAAYVFGGWYTAENGRGTQYTDTDGKATSRITGSDELTLYPYWIQILKFELTTYSGETVYSVSKADNISLVSEITVPAYYNGIKVGVVNANAFNSCSSLKVINLPDTMVYIATSNNGYSSNTGAFAKSGKIEEVNIIPTEGNHERHYFSSDGVLFYNNTLTDEFELIYYPFGKTDSEYSVPEYVANEYETDYENGQIVNVIHTVTSLATRVFYAGDSLSGTSLSKYLTAVYIPATVRNIDSQAFQSYTKIKSITFLSELSEEGKTAGAKAAESVTINSEAFKGCTGLTEITLPSVLDSFDYEIFSGCKALTKIYVSGTGGNYSSSADGMLLSADGSTLVYCPIGVSGEVDLNSLTTVVTIGENAFYNNTGITSVVIPSWITTIDSYAFYYCSALSTLTFEGTSASVSLTIKDHAFYRCTALTSLTLPENLIRLEAYSFGYCSKLLTVEFNAAPNAVIEEYAFATDSNGYYVTTVIIGDNAPVVDISAVFGYKIETLEVSSKNTNYSLDSDGILYSAGYTAVIYCPANYTGVVTLPGTVETIGKYIFRDKKISGIVIPASVTLIDDYAFYGCSSLASVTFAERTGDETLTIGDYAFYSCTWLTSVSLPANTLSLGDRAFYGCTRLQDISLPDGLKTIGDRAFQGCSNLTSISIPEGVTSIGDYLFYNCSKLEEVTIPASVEKIGSDEYGTYYVFYGCSSLKTITIAEGSKYFAVIDGNTLYGLRAEQGVEGAEEYVEDVLYTTVAAYEGAVVIPATVTKIMYRAFYNNTGITEVSFGEGTVTSLTIGDDAFSGCTALEKVTLPEGLTSMGANMFKNCSALTEIVIPSTVTSMNSGIFSGCDSLVTITFAEGGTENISFTTSSSSNPFTGAAITSIALPERVTSIPDYLFYNITTLEEVYIPSTVTSIGKASFSSDTALTTVTFADGSNLASIGQAAFIGTAITSISLPDGLTTITAGSTSGSATTGGAFENCTALVSVTIPSTIAEITAYTFSGCTSLASVTITGLEEKTCALTTIGNYAFRNTAIKEFTLPASVTTIGQYSYQNAPLETFTIQGAEDNTSELVSIDTYAFQGTSLTSFVFPASIQVIGGAASTTTASTNSGRSPFYNVSTLTSVEFKTDENGKSALKIMVYGTFAGTGLTSFEFPETDNNLSGATLNESTYAPSASTIGWYMFDGCTSLTSVTLSSAITDIYRVFEKCSSIQTVNVSEGSMNFVSDNEKGLLYDYDKTGIYLAYGNSLVNLDLSGTGVTKIGDYAFEGMTTLETVVLPGTVTYVGANAFASCTSLEKVTFLSDGNNSPLVLVAGTTESSSTSAIGVFNGCTSLKEITLREGLTEISAYLFCGCSSLEKVIVPASATAIGDRAFYKTNSLETVEFSGTNVKTIGQYAFSGSSSDYCGIKYIEIPEGVTEVKAFCFQYCANLVYVGMPTTLTTLTGNYVFGNCSSLKYIDISYITTVSNDYTFANDTALESITIPAGLTTIGARMFSGCTALSNVVFEEGVSVLGTRMFENCTALTSITLPDNDNFTTIADYAFYGCTGITQIYFPLNVTTLNQYAFAGSGLTSVDISTISSLGNYVFSGCSSLTEVTFNENITSYSNYLFQNCTSLTSVDLPENTTSLGTYMFAGSALESIEIPVGVDTISEGCFQNCTSLSEVTFLGTVTTIGRYSFDGCTSLEEIDLTSVTTLTGQAFQNSGLTSVYLPLWTEASGSSYTSFFKGCENLETVVLSPDASVIVLSMFQDCTSLKHIYYEGYDGEDNALPPAVTTINGYAFANSGIDNITIPGQVETITSGTSAIYGMFAGCENLTTVVIENGVKTIGSYAFADCTSLTEITIPYTVTTIQYAAFYNCTALEKVEFESCPDDTAYPLTLSGNSSTSHYMEGSFVGCTSLEDISLPSRLVSLGGGTFYGCTALTEIFIPYGVTDMEFTSGTLHYGYTFYECTSLTTVTFDAGVNMDIIPSYAFYGCTSLESINIPSTVTNIDQYAFYECTSLESVVLPSGVTTIGQDAFASSGLEEVTVPAGVTSLSRVFEGCLSLTDIYVATGSANFSSVDGVLYYNGSTLHTYPAGREGVVTVADGTIGFTTYAFSGCDKITDVILPDSVTAIATYVFINCTSLRSIVIPSTVASVGSNAFSGCSSLETVYYGGTEEDKDNMSITSTNNSTFTDAAWYFYSEEEPALNDTEDGYDGNYWHYDDNLEIVIWEYKG